MDIRHTLLLSALLALGWWLLLGVVPAGRGWCRAVLITLLMAVTLNYAAWRIASFPELALTAVSIWPWLFGVSELTVLVYEVWGLVVLTRRSDNTPAAAAYELRLRGERALPSIDVFIATYNEPREILEETIIAALGLDYEGIVNIIVGDDGDRVAVRDLAKRLGVDYLARPTRTDGHGRKSQTGGPGKAGNDRYAFAHTNGEFIILLDADFQVSPNFLYRTLGFLVYRRDTGMVQTPQRFSNFDVVGHNLFLGDCVPEDQHFFMAVTQPARDSWGNSFCTGTGCIVSRKLLKILDPVWGFPNSTICEDLELTYALKGIGYRTLYLNEPLAYGLAPESIPEFIKQRVRWCAGTVQQLFAPTGPIWGRLRLIDRIFYIEGVLYWLGAVFCVLFMVAPLVFWFTGVSAVLAAPEQAAGFVIPRVIMREMIVYAISDGKIPPLVATVSKIIPSFHVAISFTKALFRPRSQVFRVTTKGQNRDCVVVRWPLVLSFGAIGALTLWGMVLALVGRSAFAGSGDQTQLNLLWSSYIVVIAAVCAAACVEQPTSCSIQREVVRSNPGRILRMLLLTLLGVSRRAPTLEADGSRGPSRPRDAAPTPEEVK